MLVSAGRVTEKHHSPDLAVFHRRIKAGTVLVMATSTYGGLTAFSMQEIKINMLKGREKLFRSSDGVQMKVLAAESCMQVK